MCTRSGSIRAQVHGENRVEQGQVPRSVILIFGIAVKLHQVGVALEEKMSTTTRILLLCLLVISASGLLYAQGGANGSILGTVTDASGAVIANAKVDVTNATTGVVIHTQTSSTGDYTVPYLNPGSYK